MANKVAELIITLTDDGKINVNGAIENKMLAYGLLETAKEAICDHHKQANQLVKPVPHGFLLPNGN
jgi:hypothetical protein